MTPVDTGERYTCFLCRGSFQDNWTEAQALADAEKHFGPQNKETLVDVCEDCFNRLVAWKNAQPNPGQHRVQ